MQQQWELFQNCNKEKKKGQHFAAERQGAAADCCRTTITMQTARHWTLITTRYVPQIHLRVLYYHP